MTHNDASPSLQTLTLPELELTPADFRARMAAARDAGRPFFPWPGLEPDAWRRSLQAIETTVARVLRAQTGSGADEPAPLTAPAGSRALGIAAFTSGTGPLLGHWIRTGAVLADAETSALLQLHLDHGRRRLGRLTAAYHEVVDLLAGVGVAPTVIKGFHTAHALFPDPATRPMSDLDLVIAPAELEVASGALLRAGFTRGRHLRRPHMTEWIPPGPPVVPRSLDLTHEANPWTLDLHGTFDRDFGGVKTVSLIAPESSKPRGAHPYDELTEVVELAGRRVRVLPEPYLTAYLAAHASQELKNLSLLRIIELVWALRARERSTRIDPGGSTSAMDSSRSGQNRGARTPERSPWTSLEDLLRESGAAGYVHPAFALAERLVPGTVAPPLLALVTAAAPARVRGIVDRLQPSTAMRLEQVSLEEQFMWASGMGGYLRRVRRALWPSWAGSLREVLDVQRARIAQLVRRRVLLGARKSR